MPFSIFTPGRRAQPLTYACLKSLAPGYDPVAVARRVTIYFPAMPEVVELARQAQYNNQGNLSPITPDGIHIYQSTKPLEIKIDFSLHAYDTDYLQDQFGPVALLGLAAQLHSLTLPIYKGGSVKYPNTTVAPPPGAATGAGAQLSEAAQAAAAAAKAVQSGFNKGQGNGLNFAWPTACQLTLIKATRNGTDYGVDCLGFVRDVAVKLHGPWLYGGDNLQNLPTSADYSFTFVQQPGYTNDLTGAGGSGALNAQVTPVMAGDVFARLYNQNDLNALQAAPQRL
jgi:hypothetical protein